MDKDTSPCGSMDLMPFDKAVLVSDVHYRTPFMAVRKRDKPDVVWVMDNYDHDAEHHETDLEDLEWWTEIPITTR